MAAARTRSTTTSQAWNAAPLSASAPPLGSSEPSRSRTVAHGHSAGAPSSWEHRPQAMDMPCSAAYVAASMVSRLLPMPGSPVSAANAGAPPVPATVLSTSPLRAASSSSRPARDQPHKVGNGRGAASSVAAGGGAGAGSGTGVPVS
ncbi:hypothetical protein ACVW2K_003371 [Nocardioides sp. HB32]